VNEQAFEELKRVLATVPEGQFDMTTWHDCACGHATQDDWFVSRGFSSCNDFGRAAAFFQISRREATELFSGLSAHHVTPAEMIEKIERLITEPRAEDDECSAHERRQAVIEGLLLKANKATQSAKRVVTGLVAVFF
jgi:hypothetical protein